VLVQGNVCVDEQTRSQKYTRMTPETLRQMHGGKKPAKRKLAALTALSPSLAAFQARSYPCHYHQRALHAPYRREKPGCWFRACFEEGEPVKQIAQTGRSGNSSSPISRAKKKTVMVPLRAL